MSQKDLFSQSLFCEIPWTPQGCERLKSTLRASPEPMLCSSLPWSFGLDSSHFKLGHPTAGQKKKDPLITTLTVKLLFFSVFRASCRHPNPSLTRTVTLRALAMPSSTWLSGLTLWTENGGKVHTEIRQSGCVKNWDVSWVWADYCHLMSSFFRCFRAFHQKIPRGMKQAWHTMACT